MLFGSFGQPYVDIHTQQHLYILDENGHSNSNTDIETQQHPFWKESLAHEFRFFFAL